ncbi:hypothetical protein V6Z12_A05G191600 [Gossypium hirsutum]
MQPAAARHQFPVDEDGGSARPLQSLTVGVSSFWLSRNIEGRNCDAVIQQC